LAGDVLNEFERGVTEEERAEIAGKSVRDVPEELDQEVVDDDDDDDGLDGVNEAVRDKCLPLQCGDMWSMLEEEQRVWDA
jgi:hypothetical protein